MTELHKLEMYLSAVGGTKLDSAPANLAILLLWKIEDDIADHASPGQIRNIHYAMARMTDSIEFKSSPAGMAQLARLRELRHWSEASEDWGTVDAAYDAALALHGPMSPDLVAVELMVRIERLVDMAGAYDRLQIYRRAVKATDNVGFKASDAGHAQRRRLSAQAAAA